MTPRIVSFALLAFGLWSPATADLLGPSFVRWFWQSTAIDANFLYIAGGELYTFNETSGETDVDYTHGFHVVDISQAWNVTTITETTTATQDSNLNVRRPTFWNDPINRSVNVYGGWPYFTDPGFIPYTSSWPDNSGVNIKVHARFGNDAGVGFQFTRKAGGLETSSDKAYYNLGGFGTSNTDPLFNSLPDTLLFTESGLLEFDYANQSWTNHTTSFNRVHGEAQFIPMFGEDGVIAFIGGDKPTSQDYTVSAALVDMTTITIYDIKSQKFYDQTTSGANPTPRSTFCSVGVSSPANKTFEIFIFGGFPGTLSASTQADMGTVYILSIPSFTWTKTNATSAWRYANHCTVIGQSQMLNVGGTGANFTEPDTFPGGLGIFNLNTLSWQNNYDPDADAYTQSPSVSALYDSHGNPNSAVTFSDPALKSIFNSPTTTAPPGSQSSASGTSSPKSTTTAPAAAKTHTTAIAGGVVGGLAALAVLVGLALFWLRQRKRQTQYHQGSQEVESSDIGSGDYLNTPAIHGGELGSGNLNHPREMLASNGRNGEALQGTGYGENIQFKNYRSDVKPATGQVQGQVHELG